MLSGSEKWRFDFAREFTDVSILLRGGNEGFESAMGGKRVHDFAVKGRRKDFDVTREE